MLMNVSGRQKFRSRAWKKRVQADAARLQKDPPAYCSAAPIDPKKMDVWQATLLGPPDTPYYGGVFTLSVKMPERYPFVPPKVQFLTPIYHCNIDASGAVCLDILKDYAWSPAMTLSSVLVSLVSLLGDPNPNDPLVPDIARLYISDRKAHDRRAARETKRHASGQ